MSARIGSLPVPAPVIPRWRLWMVGSIAALFLAGGLATFALLRDEGRAPAPKPAATAPAVAAPAVAAPAIGPDQLARLRRAGFGADDGFAPAVTSVSRPAHRAVKAPAALSAAPRGFAPDGCSKIHGPC